MVLAVLLAIIIAKPLELKIFEPEIEEELVSINQALKLKQEGEIRDRYKADRERVGEEIIVLKEEIALIQEQVAQKESTKNALRADANAEADGTSGSGKYGKGPAWEEKDVAAKQAENDYTAYVASQGPVVQGKRDSIAQKEGELAQIEKSIATEIAGLSWENYDGLLARMEALGNLQTKAPPIAAAVTLITLLFIVIETAPILFKILTERGSYDLKLETLGFKVSEEERVQWALIRNDSNRQIQLSNEEQDFMLAQDKSESRHTERKMREAKRAIVDQTIEVLKGDKLITIKQKPT